MQLALLVAEINQDTVLASLMRRVGPANGANVRELATEILGTPSEPGDERLVRKVIEQLRRDGHAICATPEEGYHHAADADDLQRTCVYLARRAHTSLRQVAAMKRIALPDFYGQLGLPTPTTEEEPSQ
jgi:hypothetical protein